MTMTGSDETMNRARATVIGRWRLATAKYAERTRRQRYPTITTLGQSGFVHRQQQHREHHRDTTLMDTTDNDNRYRGT